MQKSLCTPALIYAIFASVQIIFDLFAETYTLAFIKAFLAVIFTFILNMFCVKGFSIISWFLIVVPFILTLLLFEILIFILGFTAGKALTSVNETKEAKDKETSKKDNPYKKGYMDVSYSETPYHEDVQDIQEDINIDVEALLNEI